MHHERRHARQGLIHGRVQYGALEQRRQRPRTPRARPPVCKRAVRLVPHRCHIATYRGSNMDRVLSTQGLGNVPGLDEHECRCAKYRCRGVHSSVANTQLHARTQDLHAPISCACTACKQHNRNNVRTEVAATFAISSGNATSVLHSRSASCRRTISKPALPSTTDPSKMKQSFSTSSRKDTPSDAILISVSSDRILSMPSRRAASEC